MYVSYFCSETGAERVVRFDARGGCGLIDIGRCGNDRRESKADDSV